MGLVEKIKYLCNAKKTNFAEVERNTGISNGQIRRWNSSSPKIENVKKVADYFDVSVDYLLGRTEDDEIHTIAAHHDGEDWTEEELKTIEEFKRFVKSQRENKE